MKYTYGKYITWVGPYQVANWLQHIGVSEEYCDIIGEKLSKTWFNDFCQWVHGKKKQKIVVKMDNWDTWGADSMLSHIILPTLKTLKEKKQGTPFVYNCDLPDELKSSRDGNLVDPGQDGNWNEDGWNYLMDEMIWAFERIQNDDMDEMSIVDGTYDKDLYLQLSKRCDFGTTMFGKYIRSMWD